MDNDTLRAKWDRRYRGAEDFGSPAEVLVANQHLLPAAGKALDLACGLGASALLLARLGLETTAWDLSPVAIGRLAATAKAEGLPLQASVRDVERTPFPAAAFDVIVVRRFLERRLCPAIAEALRPGGLLFYQTFTRERVGDAGPSNPDYRLGRNELLRLFPGLELVVYREEGRLGHTARGFRDEAMLVAHAPAE